MLHGLYAGVDLFLHTLYMDLSVSTDVHISTKVMHYLLFNGADTVNFLKQNLTLVPPLVIGLVNFALLL